MGGLGALLNALRTIRAEPLRTGLTMFGVVWGTASVIFLLSWGLGIARMLEEGMQKIGKNAVFVSAGQIGEEFTPATDRRRLWLTPDDVTALKRRARLPELITPESQRWVTASYGQKSVNLDVRGVEPEMVDLRVVRLAAGRNLNPDDVRHRRRVVLLGETARRRLLGPRRAVGSHIRLDGRSFEVVGVLARVGTQLSRDSSEIDEQAWIPLTSFFTFPAKPGHEKEEVETIVLRVRGPGLLPATGDEIRAILAERLGVSVEDEEAIRLNSTMDALEVLPIDETGVVLFILAAGALAIGGVGILAMMLDAVQERRQEIGVRLAVGARPRDVLAQFFLETFLMTSLGGVLGLAIGVGASGLLSLLEAPDLIPLPILRAWIVWLAIGTMVVVGVASGVIPAWRASRVDPAETLRSE